MQRVWKCIFKHANTRSEGHRLTEKGSWSILRYISRITEQQCLLRPFQSSKKHNIMRARNAWFVKIKRCVLRRPNRSGTKLFDAASRQPPHIFQLLEFWQSTAFLLWTLRNKHLLPSPHMEQHLYVPPWCLHCPDEGLARMHICRLAPCPTDIWFFGETFLLQWHVVCLGSSMTESFQVLVLRCSFYFRNEHDSSCYKGSELFMQTRSFSLSRSLSLTIYILMTFCADL